MKKIKIAALIAAVMMAAQAVTYAAPAETAAPQTPPEATAGPQATAEPEDGEESGDIVILSPEYSIFEQMAEYASEYYIYDDKSPEEIMQTALSDVLFGNEELLNELLKASFQGLDMYSDYYTAEEFQAVMANESKIFYGLGIHLQTIDSYVTIVGFEDSSSGRDAGLLENDRIVKINGQDVVGWSAVDAKNAIVSDAEGEVALTILRGEQTLEITSPLAMAYQPTVSYESFSEDTAYIKISSMAENTAAEFAAALDTARSEGIENIVLDLRDNPGGYVSTVLEIARMIVPAGVIVSTEYRNPEDNTVEYSELEETEFNFNILINGNTASSAEILASAMQDSGAATLYGTISYGKGLIQRFFPLVNGAAFKITNGEYKTRNGNSINDVGIYPDVEVTNIVRYIDTSQFTPFDYKTKWDIGMEGEGVRAGKERLKLLGYYTGQINDTYDLETATAVRKFQEENELYAYGVMDITTQRKITEVFADIKVEEDVQQRTALEAFGVTFDNEEAGQE